MKSYSSAMSRSCTAASLVRAAGRGAGKPSQAAGHLHVAVRAIARLSFLGLLALPAFASFPNGYSYCKLVITQHTMVSGSSDLANYPLAVIVTDAALKTVASGGTVNNANGYDIGFGPDCSGYGTMLKWEVESFNPSSGAVVAHVLRPAFSHTSDDTIGMYYGDAGCPGTCAFTTFQSTPSAVWDTNYKGVWHLGDGGTLSVADSSGNAKNGTPQNAPTAAAGVVDGGMGLSSATGQYVNTASLSGSALTNFTISAWVKPSGNQDPGAAILTQTFTAAVNYALFFDDQLGSPNLNITGGYYNGAWRRTPPTTIPSNAWTFAVVTYDGATVKLYLNNNAPITTSIASTPTSSGTGVNIGKRWDTGKYINGTLDEVRISGIARSSDWILTEYRNQSAPGTYISLGPQVSSPSSPTTHVPHRVIGGE